MTERKQGGLAPWVCGLTSLLAGLLLGLNLIPWLVGPFLGSADTASAGAGSLPDRATLVDLPMPLRVAPGIEVTAQWLVTNAGERVWTPGEYRFLPETEGLPILPLPRTVPPGRSVWIRLRLPVRPGLVGRTVRWSLAGPRGPVPGGELELTLRGPPARYPAGD